MRVDLSEKLGSDWLFIIQQLHYFLNWDDALWLAERRIFEFAALIWNQQLRAFIYRIIYGDTLATFVKIQKLKKTNFEFPALFDVNKWECQRPIRAHLFTQMSSDWLKARRGSAQSQLTTLSSAWNSQTKCAIWVLLLRGQTFVAEVVLAAALRRMSRFIQRPWIRRVTLQRQGMDFIPEDNVTMTGAEKSQEIPELAICPIGQIIQPLGS